jgi:ketosteroid isomerase-like protein
MFPDHGDYRGYDGLRKFTRNQAEAFEQMWAEPAEFVEADDQVVVLVQFGGTARHTGIETAFSAAHVWTIDSGKVSRIDMYRDRESALKAVGLEE